MTSRTLLTLICLLALTWTAPVTADDRPNIVMIMADDLGFADLGCYGSEIKTPNLDALAASGLRFSQFYNTAKCHSSRVSLLTGLYCDQAGGASLNHGATIAEVLGSAGYSTTMVGKWHLDKEPTDFGFERYWGHLSGSTNFFVGNDSFRLNGEKWAVPAKLNGRRFYTTNAKGDFALDFLNEVTKEDRPFLLYAAFNAPHYPLQAPEEDVKKYKGKYDCGWDELRTQRHNRQIDSGLLPAKWKLSPRPSTVPAWDSLDADEKHWEARRMEVYAAMVEVLDRNIGRIISALKEKGVFDNTLILFCSDNGACPFERTKRRDLEPWDAESYWTYDASWAHAGNTPFRLYKQNQHEGGISSPLIVSWPNGLKTEPGAITRQPGHLVDLMASFVDVSGAKYPTKVGERTIDPLQGKSLLPIFQGKKRVAHETLYFHFGTDRALRQGPWKIASAKLGRWELYHLDDDRTETNDLSQSNPERVEAMSKVWFQMAKDVDRLQGRALSPVGKELKVINFRKDTRPGSQQTEGDDGGTKNQKLLFKEDFENGIAGWELIDPKSWKVEEHGMGKSLSIIQRESEYKPKVRSPRHIALMKDIEIASFELTFKVKSTKNTGNHRDCCIFFNYQDPTHYYYIHLGAKPDPNSGQIFIVNDAPRSNLTNNKKRVPWTDDWHTVKVIRNAANGLISVYFDDMQKPHLQVNDKTFGKGRMGLGSFDDMDAFDDVQLRALTTNEKK